MCHTDKLIVEQNWMILFVHKNLLKLNKSVNVCFSCTFVKVVIIIQILNFIFFFNEQSLLKCIFVLTEDSLIIVINYILIFNTCIYILSTLSYLK